MVFWRSKKNQKSQEEEQRDEKLLHPNGEPEIEPSIDQDDSAIDEATKHDVYPTESEIIDDLAACPTPETTLPSDLEQRAQERDEKEKGGWLSRLTSGLTKSSSKFTQGIGDILTKKKLDQEMLDGLEDALITADLGPKTASKIVWDISKDRFGKDVTEDEVKEALAQSISDVLEPVAKPLDIKKPEEGGPFVILVCGVNGAGKTTTIGKIAHQLAFVEKKKVMLAAGDTFRAAAVEQLKVWAERVHCGFLSKDIGADAAAVAYEAYETAKKDGADVLMIDTAGRLQNKSNLMDELTKVVRVLQKQNDNLPHAVLLVLDATTGQNAFSQVDVFKKMVDVSGLIVTKLDGTAKGGVLVGLADEFGLPVHSIGVGEGIEDLAPFQAKDYARALLGLKS